MKYEKINARFIKILIVSRALVVTSLNLDAILAMRFTNPKKEKFVITDVITKLS